jgi:hypothetical protein
MKDAFVRMGRAGLPLAAALAVAGCAWQAMEAASDVKVGIAEPPEAKEVRTAAPKPKDKVAAVKKPDASTPAKQPRPLARQDEASCANVDTCVSVLKAMVADPERAWMRQPASPAVLANGVRLFAYRALKTQLTCGELAAAMTEIETAAQTFSGGVGGLKPEQITRVRILSVEVGTELQAENAQRCSSPGKVGPIGALGPAGPVALGPIPVAPR